MNKKLFKTLAATAMSVLAIACAKEPVAGVDGETGVSFTIDVPGAPATKAYGEAEKATKLYYQVFDNAGNAIEGLGVQTTDLVGKTAKVSFQLVKDQTYNFIFWAQTAEAGYYEIDATEGLKKITANYTDKLANDENFDAFYAVKKLKISGPVAESVELTRPFAQINIATKGVLKAGETETNIDFTGATSSVTIKDVPTEFYPLSPAASQLGSETVTAKFKTADAPSGDITVNSDTYKYLAVNYVFAPADGVVYDITASLKIEGKTVSLNVPAAPAKRNWRTNILGNLLTSSADINVVVTPGFDENGNENIDLNNIKTETELKAALATYGAAKISNDVAMESYVSIKNNSLITIESTGSIAPASDMRKDIAEVIYVSGGTLTLEGEGKVIGQSNGTYYTGSQAITVAGGTLNIKGNLEIEAGSGSVKSDRAVYVRKGTLNIYGGYFHTSDDASGNPNPVIFLKPDWQKTANCNIYGGVFESDGKPDYLINIEDSERARADIKIYGGKFKGFDPGDNIAEGSKTNFLAPGYKSTLIGEYYVVTKEDVTPVASQDGLENTLSTILSQTTPATVELSSGTYKLPKLNSALENVTFVGDGETTIDLKSATDMPADNGRPYNNVSFKNIKFITWASDYCGFRHSNNLLFEDCTFEGKHFAYGAETYRHCVFTQTSVDYNIWTYSSAATFDDCTFNGLGKAVLVYKESGTEVIKVQFNNCKFNASASVEGKAAIEIDSSLNPFEVYINNCKSEGFDNGSKSGNSLWNNKKGDSTNLKVVVDGIEQTLN